MLEIAIGRRTERQSLQKLFAAASSFGMLRGELGKGMK
jgi:hypothetical protein